MKFFNYQIDDSLIKKYAPITFFALVALILFANNHIISLWDQDESAYAGFALNMKKSDNWLIPDFMWSDVHRKPPLHFWNIAISYHIFGVNEFSVRFPSSLLIFATYLLVYLWGKPLFGNRVSFYGSVVLSTSFLVTSLAKVSVTDATLLFFTTVCALAILHLMQEKSWKWVLIFWGSFSLAVLTKGPPVIMFSIMLMGILFVFHPNRKNLILLHPWFFLPLACLPLYIWGWYCTQIPGGKDFITWMIDWYILKRVSGSVFGQTGPPGTHLVGIFVFFIPYLMFTPRAFGNSILYVFKDKGTGLLLGAWFVAAWFIFELSPSKLPAYVVAAHVPLALLIAQLLSKYETTGERPHKLLAVAHFILATIIFLALCIIPFYLELTIFKTIAFVLCGIALLGAVALSIAHYRKKSFIALMLITNLTFQIAAWVVLLPLIDVFKDSSKRIGEYVAQNASSNASVWIANDHGHPPSLPFYLKLNFENVAEEKNIETLVNQYRSSQPHVFILNEDQKNSFIALIPDAQYETISSLLIDRNQQAYYYVLMNKTAAKSNEP